MAKHYCPDCGGEMEVPDDTENGEIISCPSCGLELEIKVEIDGFSFHELTIEGEDWGE
jgi:alpha-aminoadipate carrier protein LysW